MVSTICCWNNVQLLDMGGTPLHVKDLPSLLSLLGEERTHLDNEEGRWRVPAEARNRRGLGLVIN